jgi:signal transduction histidine kinase
MEKAELDKQKALLEKYASVGKLAAGIVHEVNNPLDGIIRFTNMLLNQIEHGSVAREYLLEIKRGLNRIENITKSLLQFSHQVNPHTMKVKNYADVHELIEESLSIFEARLTHHFAVHKYFNMSRTRILDIGVAHIFINLIKNALDAMPNGGTLEISTDSDEEWVRINFKDSGCGMSAELCERIFEPFFTTKNMDKGSGLGLAICREIINRYEGSILVESVPGKGSTFRVMIPVKFCENV